MTFDELEKRLRALRQTNHQEIGCRVGEMISLLEEIYRLKQIVIACPLTVSEIALHSRLQLEWLDEAKKVSS